jgi:hypothetical protein
MPLLDHHQERGAFRPPGPPLRRGVAGSPPAKRPEAPRASAAQWRGGGRAAQLRRAARSVPAPPEAPRASAAQSGGGGRAAQLRRAARSVPASPEAPRASAAQWRGGGRAAQLRRAARSVPAPPAAPRLLASLRGRAAGGPGPGVPPRRPDTAGRQYAPVRGKRTLRSEEGAGGLRPPAPPRRGGELRLR